MIHFFIGTKAQFIKMAPIMVEFQKRDIRFRYIDSGQHAALTRRLRECFGIREPDICFHESGDVTSIMDAVGWSCKLSLKCLKGKRWLRKHIFPGGGICLIHGDTISTLLGILMARAARIKVGHVEAGLRSFNILHPFPEELIRIHCMKRSHILFAPSEEAESNLRNMKIRGQVVRIDGNTVVDSLRLMKNLKSTVKIPSERFALATCHRLETITRRKNLEKVVLLLNHLCQQIKIIFVTHEPTRKYLKRFGLLEKLNQEIDLLDMLDYLDFTSLLQSAKMVLTDGGSIQEECAYLNKPCLILRKRTERPDGLGKNAMLWGFDNSILEEFLSKAKSTVETSPELWPRPSEEIVDNLLKKQGQ
jgi:UDP-N-acetylglucosamine 2-epimerase (non-hydrolysing)